MSEVRVDIDGREYRFDTAAGISLAVPLRFDGEQPNFFGAPRASAEIYRAGEFTGATRAGGSCNVATLHLTPHCNGTHTECIGHVVDDPVTLAEIPSVLLVPATLVSIDLAGEAAQPIGRAALEAALSGRDPDFCRALIVRTRPNDAGKMNRRYALERPAAWFDAAAMQFIRDLGVEHLLVDLPSLDRMDDAGLAAHRIFWGLPPGSRALADAQRPNATVTELVYAPDRAADGRWLLSLQWPALATDAAPSRPLIFSIA